MVDAVSWLGITGLGAMSLCLVGCRAQTQDTLLSWAENPSHRWRAVVVQREYFMDGHRDGAPAMYVLLEQADGAPKYENGQEFEKSEVVMKPLRCGPLSVHWTGDLALEVECERCGLALAEAGPHAGTMGPVRVEYSGFPEQSSWETAPTR